MVPGLSALAPPKRSSDACWLDSVPSAVNRSDGESAVPKSEAAASVSLIASKTRRGVKRRERNWFEIDFTRFTRPTHGLYARFGSSTRHGDWPKNRIPVFAVLAPLGITELRDRTNVTPFLRRLELQQEIPAKNDANNV